MTKTTKPEVLQIDDFTWAVGDRWIVERDFDNSGSPYWVAVRFEAPHSDNVERIHYCDTFDEARDLAQAQAVAE